MIHYKQQWKLNRNNALRGTLGLSPSEKKTTGKLPCDLEYVGAM
jgi:hypothetical protein